MTPREKAYQICNDIVWAMGYGNLDPEIKATALILVDEIIDAVVVLDEIDRYTTYWQEVKKEIEKL
jgi:hypothetical protein